MEVRAQIPLWNTRCQAFWLPKWHWFAWWRGRVNENPSADLLLLKDSWEQGSRYSKTGFWHSLFRNRNSVLIPSLVREKKKKKLYLPLLMFCMHSLVSLVLPLFENRSQCHVLLRLVGWYVLCYSASYSLCSFQYCTTPHDRDIPKRSRLPSVEQEKSYVFNK